MVNIRQGPFTEFPNERPPSPQPSPARGEGVKSLSSPLMGEDKGEGDEPCRPRRSDWRSVIRQGRRTDAEGIVGLRLRLTQPTKEEAGRRGALVLFSYR